MKRANSCVCVEPQIQEKKKQRSNPPKATEARRGGSPDGDSEDILGRDVRLIKRHMYDGSVSKNPKRNNFIDAGRLKNVCGSALDKVYGKDEDGNPFCHSSLCSFRFGAERMALCDCRGKRSHKLPRLSGPGDTKNWNKVMELSNKAAKNKEI